MSQRKTTLADERLGAFVQRIERLTEEKRALQNDINEVFAEAKGTGFDTKIMRKLMRERAMDPNALAEENELLDLYRKSLGDLADMPLGQAVIRKVTTERVMSRKRAAKEAEPERETAL